VSLKPGTELRLDEAKELKADEVVRLAMHCYLPSPPLPMQLLNFRPDCSANGEVVFWFQKVRDGPLECVRKQYIECDRSGKRISRKRFERGKHTC